MKQISYPNLGETVYECRLKNGLQVAIVPRFGFQKKIAYFVTDFGAIHTEFTLDGETLSVPGGIAHYLEHKMFDMPGYDVSARFAQLGANVNAFTSYDLTAYYFSCTENFYDCLETLLDFVSTGYFTEESVEKEQGIIGQEIGMNEDNPDTCIFESMVECLYEKHPVTVPILGTRESIARITSELLHKCHKAFYRPDNMLLCIVGDVDPKKVVRLAEKIPAGEGTVTRTQQWPEEMKAVKSYANHKMEVAMPMFQMGFKCEPVGMGAEAVRAEAIGDIAAEVLFGESSALYLKMYEKGLIDASFGGGFDTIDGLAMLTLAGDSMHPQKVKESVLREAKRICKTGIDLQQLQRIKRSALGRKIRELDSFDSVAFRVCAYHFSGFSYFRFPEIYANITQEDVLEFIRRVVTEDRCALTVIEPK